MKLAAVVFLILTVAAPSTFGVEKPETSHLVFVTEYIRELSAIERIRDSGEQELKKDPDNPFSNTIHISTLIQLELASQIRMLRGMRLKAPHDHLISNITALYERKIVLWRRMAEIGSTLIGGQKPGVDFAKLAAEMLEIRGQMDFIDHALFEASPAVFATLIDLKEDSKGHTSHLIITKEQRAELIDNINTTFGTKLDANDQNSIVAAASVFKAGLLKDFKSSDEPWE